MKTTHKIAVIGAFCCAFALPAVAETHSPENNKPMALAYYDNHGYQHHRYQHHRYCHHKKCWRNRYGHVHCKCVRR